MKTFNTEFEIYFEDISPSGIVHLEKIAEWMSMGREQFFKATCPDHLWLAEGEIFVFTVSMSISVKGHSRWSDKIKAVITTSNVKKISYMLHFDFYNEGTNEIIAQGIQKVAFVKSGNEKFAPIPDDIKDVVVNYLC
ncbi:MAG: acyl-CoA thioesterase [Candidatus Omnitrophica bacterium]|nr:acyl-CoA thioesterase [Candidatus Omnitrophota bacterium]